MVDWLSSFLGPRCFLFSQELTLLDSLIYKNRSQHRSTKYFSLLLEVLLAFGRFLKVLELVQPWKTITSVVPGMVVCLEKG